MNFETLFLDVFESITSIDFNMVTQILLLALGVFWFFVVGWVFLDARERVHSRAFIILSMILVAIFNIPGLLIYMIIRPKLTLAEQYWSDLERRYLLFETAELYDCSNCGFPLQPGFLNCPNCGDVIKVKCECGANVDKYWKYCSKCGKKSTYIRETIVTQEVVNEEAKEDPKTKKFSLGVFERFNNLKKSLDEKLRVLKENRRLKAEAKKTQAEVKKTKKGKKKKGKKK